MAAAIHRIDRLVIDVALATAAPAPARVMQERLSVFCRDRLPQVLEHGLAGIDQHDRALALERIELDLGEVSANAGNDELCRRVERALAACLANLKLAGQLAAPDPALQALADFLGGAGAHAAGAADAHLMAALRAGPAALAGTLRRWGERQEWRSRLAHALSAPVRAHLVRLLAGQQGDVINDYVADLSQLHRRRPLVPESGATFDTVVWELVLAWLLVERGSHHNNKAFLASHVERLGARYRIGYAAMLMQLTRSVAAFGTSTSSRYDLGSALAELARDARARPRDEAHAPGTLAHEARLLHGLDTFLRCGGWPGATHAGESAAAALSQLLQADPDGLRRLLRQRCAGELALRRLLAALAEGQDASLVHLLEPADGARIVAHLAALRLMHTHRPLVAQAAAPLARATWQLALRYLLASRASRFNSRSFIKDLVRKLAARHELRYDSLLFALLASTPVLGPSGAHGLADILLSLADEALLGVAPGQAGAGDAAADALAHWLVHGAAPGWTPDMAVRTAAAQSPRALARLLRLGGHHAGQRLAAGLGEQALHSLLDVLAGPAAGEIADAVALLTVAHERRALAGLDGAAFARVIWTPILEFLLAAPTPPRLAALARHLAGALARHLGMPVDDAARWLRAGLEAGPPGHEPLRAGAIARALAALAVDASPAPAQREQASAGADPADHLACLLLHGVTPAGVDPGALDAWLAAIDERVWRTVLGRHGHRAPVLRRLAETLGPQARDTVLRLAGGIHFPRIRELIEALGGACRRLGLASEREFSAALHYCLLAYLLAGGATARPRLGFRDLVLQVVQALSARYLKPCRVLLEQALAACGDAGSLRPALLLAYHARPAGRASAVASGGIGPQAAQELALHYLQTGTLPPSAPHGAPAAVLEQLGSGALLAAGVRLADALLALPDKEAVARRLLRNLPPPRRRALLRLWAPAYAGLLESLLLACESGARRLAGTTPGTLLSCHWEQIVAVLLRGDTGAWQGQRLLGEIADRVAQRMGLARGAYLALMCDAARQHARVQQRFEPLHDLLDQMRRAGGDEPVSAAASAHASVDGGAANPCAALEALLRYGSAPPACDGAPAQLVDAALEREPEALRQLLLEAARNVLERHRLARLLSDQQLQRVLPGLLGQQYRAARLCLRALRDGHAALQGGAADAGLLYVEELWHQLHLHRNRPFSLPAYAGAAARRARAELGVPEQALLAQAGRALDGSAARQQVSAALAQAAIECEQHELAWEHGLAVLPLSADVAEPPARGEDRRTRPWPPEGSALPAGEPFLVPNAGLVLLWQFLHPYFAALGLLSGRLFAGPRQQHRAACLLQLLACGRMQAPEHDLLLNKLLCGVEPGMPIECDADATDDETALAEQLLYSVTQHWKPMKNTSVDVLRASFLMRPGSLVRQDAHWTLTVAAGPYDMLLQSLPWPIATIRLPWMHDLLGVQWT